MRKTLTRGEIRLAKLSQTIWLDCAFISAEEHLYNLYYYIKSDIFVYVFHFMLLGVNTYNFPLQEH